LVLKGKWTGTEARVNLHPFEPFHNKALSTDAFVIDPFDSLSSGYKYSSQAKMGNPIPRKQNIMAQSTYQSVVLVKRPEGLIIPGETLVLKENPMLSEKDVKNDQVLVEIIYLSLDPAMRGWLNGMS
jgi:hypothetical protein